eukprot:16446748-Heterocapsa_arctica.AAC.1
MEANNEEIEKLKNEMNGINEEIEKRKQEMNGINEEIEKRKKEMNSARILKRPGPLDENRTLRTAAT